MKKNFHWFVLYLILNQKGNLICSTNVEFMLFDGVFPSIYL